MTTHNEFININRTVVQLQGDGFPLNYDGTGHGTAVSSMIAGQTLGVAKQVDLTVVRDPFQTIASRIACVNWIKNDMINWPNTAVLNMCWSILDPNNTWAAFDIALTSLLNTQKIFAVVACSYTLDGSTPWNLAVQTPTRLPGVYNVQSTDSADGLFGLNGPQSPNGTPYLRPSLGPYVDIFAPGAQNFQFGFNDIRGIRIALASSNTGYDDLNVGSSVAAPLVSGVAAMYLQSSPRAAPYQLRNALTKTATKDLVATSSGLDGSPNLLLYSNFGMPYTANAANYLLNLAVPGGIVSLFGDFGSAATRVTVEGVTNSSEVDCTILYAGAGQINLAIPAGIPLDAPSMLKIYNGTTLIGHGAPMIRRLDPGVFTANSVGTGLAAGQLLRVNKVTSQQSTEELSATGNILNPTTEDAYLILYATAIRNRFELSQVIAKVNGVTVPTAYAGPQGFYAGLDQINIGPLPSSLKGIGLKNFNLTVEGIPANVVQVNLQ